MNVFAGSLRMQRRRYVAKKAPKTKGIDRVILALKDYMECSEIQLRGGIPDPTITPLLLQLCERYGYGNVIATASMLWRGRQDDTSAIGAFCYGMCVGTVKAQLREAQEALKELGGR